MYTMFGAADAKVACLFNKGGNRQKQVLMPGEHANATPEPS